MPKKQSKITKDDIKLDPEREKKIKYFVELVGQVRLARDKKAADIAFKKIEEMMKQKMEQLSYQIKIPGCRPEDLYQEALFALRYKAIKDYDQTRSKKRKIAPFDSFAILCIRRHLSTKRKSSFQNKQIVMNKAKSLEQNRSKSNSQDENVTLSDMIAATGLDSLSTLEEKENYNFLMKNLWEKMTVLEKEVFLYHKHNLSYDEIACKIYNKKAVTIKETKSVDNALSRIKTKAHSLYRQHTKED